MRLLLAFLVALVTALLLTLPVRQFAFRIGMIDQPGARKIHQKPTPLLGGVAIYTALVIALLVSDATQEFRSLVALIAGATLLLLVGTLDDRGLLHHQVKLFVAMPAASVIVLASGIRAQVFSTLFRGHIDSSADAILTVFWITGITASFSILDYMDGVCAGIATIAAVCITVLAILNDQMLVAIPAAAVAGAALGFLWWNFSPAKIFMGDGGAMMLGFLVGTFALTLRIRTASRGAAWLTALFIVAVPILDTTLVSVSRLRRGLIPFTNPGKDHLGHRLANCGMGTRGSVVVMYTVAVICGSIALFCTQLTAGQVTAIALAALICLAVGIAALERVPFEHQQPRTFA
jgi:UDP-GlcNAc:undecaprenyl-phosphate/decaprenyl-phosphate GlcNAc-1-phosphate transferase